MMYLRKWSMFTGSINIIVMIKDDANYEANKIVFTSAHRIHGKDEDESRRRMRRKRRREKNVSLKNAN